MKLKITFFFIALILSPVTSILNAQTTIPKGKAQLIEFTNATAKFTVPDGKTWTIYNVFSDEMTDIQLKKEGNENYYSKDYVKITIKSIDGIIKTDFTKNIYGPLLFNSGSTGSDFDFPLIFPEKTSFELLIYTGGIGKEKLYAGSGYINIIETDN